MFRRTAGLAAAELPITWEDTRAAEIGAMASVEGEYSIASFNVLNYFTSLGKDEEGCRAYNDMYGNPVSTNYCDVRGAYSEEAFRDQIGGEAYLKYLEETNSILSEL